MVCDLQHPGETEDDTQGLDLHSHRSPSDSPTGLEEERSAEAHSASPVSCGSPSAASPGSPGSSGAIHVIVC